MSAVDDLHDRPDAAARWAASVPTVEVQAWTPERTAIVAAGMQAGVSAREIADSLGVSRGAVLGKMFRVREGSQARDTRARVYLTRETADRIEAAADARGVRPRELARAILDAVVADGLIEAVLDR